MLSQTSKNSKNCDSELNNSRKQFNVFLLKFLEDFLFNILKYFCGINVDSLQIEMNTFLDDPDTHICGQNFCKKNVNSDRNIKIEGM